MTRKKIKRGASEIIKIPKKFLLPVTAFLKAQLKKAQRSKKNIEAEDPFKDEKRVTDNAAPDTEAEEQFGHARVIAIKAQLDKKIIQTKKALARARIGKYGICENCREMIDTDRLIIYPEVTLCVKCEAKKKK